MEEFLNRFWTDLMSRPAGPLNLRFLIQPATAMVFGIRAGIKDARLGRSRYLQSAVSNKDARRGVWGEIWMDIGKLFVMACVLDTVFQLITLSWVYPLETLVIAIALALIPYLAARAITGRIANFFIA